MSVSSFLQRNSKLYPSGLNGDEKEVGRWQDVLTELSINKTPDDVIDAELLSSDDVKKQETLQYVLDVICSIPTGRQVVSDVFRLNCSLSVKDDLEQPALYDASAKKLLLSSSGDYSLEDKAAFFVKQCAAALQDDETPGMISDAEASVVKAVFVVQMKNDRPEIFEKMAFHKKDKLTGMCAHLYSSLNDWGKTAAELFKFCK